MNVLYVTWDGPQVTYLEGLFAPIFERLAGSGYRFRVVQFTWAGRARCEATAGVCRARGIPYVAVPVLHGPLFGGVPLTLARGALALRRELREHRTDVLMPRSTFPGFMASLVKPPGVRMVYDADGLPVDERVESGGLAPSGPTARVLRAFEKQALRAADVVLTRTEFGRDVMRKRAGKAAGDGGFFVVANGRDGDVFSPRGEAANRNIRATFGAGEAPLVVYAGSLGSQYDLASMAQTVRAIAARRPDVVFLVLTGEPDRGRELESLCGGVRTEVKRVGAGEVARYLSAADVGLSFRSPLPSMRAVSPVKVGEYLLCGVPVLGSLLPDLPAEGGLPSVLRAVDPGEEGRARAAAWFVDDVLPARDRYRQAARAVGQAHYSLEHAARTYEAALGALPRNNPTRG